ncbi:MAG: hypothetical protein ACJA1Z_002948 [Patiriisocius sp.]|jgi:hypothetical protein
MVILLQRKSKVSFNSFLTAQNIVKHERQIFVFDLKPINKYPLK